MKGGGGVLIPFPSKLFFSNPSLCCSNLNSYSHFLLFLFHESQSQCTKSHFPASKKGKSQLTFYPFTTLYVEDLQRRNREKIGGPLSRTSMRCREKKKNDTDTCKPVAHHCNLPNHSQYNMTICGLSLHHGNTKSHKNIEQKLIFQ